MAIINSDAYMEPLISNSYRGLLVFIPIKPSIITLPDTSKEVFGTISSTNPIATLSLTFKLLNDPSVAYKFPEIFTLPPTSNV